MLVVDSARSTQPAALDISTAGGDARVRLHQTSKVRVHSRTTLRRNESSTFPAAIRTELVTWATRPLVRLPEPLPELRLPGPLLSLSSDRDAPLLEHVKHSNAVLAGPARTTHYVQLLPVPPISLKPIVLKLLKPPCGDSELSSDMNRYCVALYKKQRFQYLAQTVSRSRDDSFGPAAGSDGLSWPGRHSVGSRYQVVHPAPPL